MNNDVTNRFTFLATAFLFCLLVGAPQSVNADEVGLERMHWLLGEWRGVGDGKWGRNAAERAYSLVLDDAFIRGLGRSVYPKQDKNEAGEIHESVDMYSFDQGREMLVLRQFDNESFVTTYYLNTETSNESQLVFDAEQLENVPPGWRARVTFLKKGQNAFHELFELDTANGTFELYLTTRFLKVSD